VIDVRNEVLEAEERIRSPIRKTPVDHSPFLSQKGKCNAFLKLENLQITGSFKLRGALNKLLSLSKERLKKGVITASSGNHGAAFAYIVQKHGWKGIICVPENTSKSKIEALRLYGADIHFIGNDYIQTELYAIETAQKKGYEFISAYNDPKIIGGQGTIGIELSEQLNKIDVVFVPLGGGGLISGVAGFLKAVNNNIKIIGCQPKNSPVMYESIKAGRIIEMDSKPTLSDGTAGGIDKDALTFDLCRKYVDDYVLISEKELKEAVRLFIEKHHMIIEGAAALSVASFLKIKQKLKGKNVVLIISGAKISIDKLKEIICE